MAEEFDIDDELADLWMRAYCCTCSTIRSMTKTKVARVRLPYGPVEEVIVDEFGMLCFKMYNSQLDFAETFEDAVLFDVLRILKRCFAH